MPCAARCQLPFMNAEPAPPSTVAPIASGITPTLSMNSWASSAVAMPPAALAPTPGNWLYFVTVDPNAKVTKFTDSYQEFLKYVDGLAGTVWWHQGRSPAYGQGVTFWALGEMIRARCGLLEGADERTTRAQVAATVAEHVPDAAERAWGEVASPAAGRRAGPGS